MGKEILNVNEAYFALTEGMVVIDTLSTKFKLKSKVIFAKSENASFKLNKDEFLQLYKNTKFVILDDNSEIDLKKDEEYYAFKHK